MLPLEPSPQVEGLTATVRDSFHLYFIVDSKFSPLITNTAGEGNRLSNPPWLK